MTETFQNYTSQSFTASKNIQYEKLVSDYNNNLKNRDCNKVVFTIDKLIKLNNELINYNITNKQKKEEIEKIRESTLNKIQQQKNSSDSYNTFTTKRKVDIKKIQERNKDIDSYFMFYIVFSAIFLVTEVGIIYAL